MIVWKIQGVDAKSSRKIMLNGISSKSEPICVPQESMMHTQSPDALLWLHPDQLLDKLYEIVGEENHGASCSDTLLEKNQRECLLSLNTVDLVATRELVPKVCCRLFATACMSSSSSSMVVVATLQ